MLVAFGRRLPCIRRTVDGGRRELSPPIRWAACEPTFAKARRSATSVTLILDWMPNTNHTGFYVAQALGYYEEANLDVSIQEPTDLQVETVVTSGAAQFGVATRNSRRMPWLRCPDCFAGSDHPAQHIGICQPARQAPAHAPGGYGWAALRRFWAAGPGKRGAQQPVGMRRRRAGIGGIYRRGLCRRHPA